MDKRKLYLCVVEGEELVAESTDFTVHDETLEVNVGHSQAGETRSLVAATGLETNEAVLNNVNTADTVTTGNGVDGEEDLGGISLALLAVVVLELDGETLLEGEGEVLGSIGSLGRVDGELPHILRGSDVGVLEDAGLVGAVRKVLVHGPGLALGRCDGDTALLSVVEEILATLEAVVEDGVSPRSDDLDGGLESVKGQLETNLVVALAGAAVRDGKAALLLRNLDLSTGNDGTGKRGACCTKNHTLDMTSHKLRRVAWENPYREGRRSRRWRCIALQASRAPQ